MHLTVSRPALVNCTNVYTKDIQSPWTILQQAGTKRPAIEQQNGGLKKRVKVSSNKEQQQEHNLVDDEDSDEDSESDAEMEDVVDVVVIIPAVGEGIPVALVKTDVDGCPKLARLMMSPR